MNNLLQRIIDLLGTSPDGAGFQDLILELDGKSIAEETHFSDFYMFVKLGLTLTTEKKQNQFKSVFVHLYSVGVQCGEITPFSGKLPFGIESGDTRESIKIKMGVDRDADRVQGRTPQHPKDFWDTFRIDPLEYCFIFDGGTQRLCGFSVYYSVDNVLDGPPPPEPDEYIQNEASLALVQSLRFAEEEARKLNHGVIGSDFLLIGLLKHDNNIAAQALKSHGLSFKVARAEMLKIIGVGSETIKGKIPFSPGAKKILAEARRLSHGLGSTSIKTEHCLMSIIDGPGVGVRILKNLKVDLYKLEQEILKRIEEQS